MLSRLGLKNVYGELIVKIDQIRKLSDIKKIIEIYNTRKMYNNDANMKDIRQNILQEIIFKICYIITHGFKFTIPAYKTPLQESLNLINTIAEKIKSKLEELATNKETDTKLNEEIKDINEKIKKDEYTDTDTDTDTDTTTSPNKLAKSVKAKLYERKLKIFEELKTLYGKNKGIYDNIRELFIRPTSPKPEISVGFIQTIIIIYQIGLNKPPDDKVMQKIMEVIKIVYTAIDTDKKIHHENTRDIEGSFPEKPKLTEQELTEPILSNVEPLISYENIITVDNNKFIDNTNIYEQFNTEQVNFDTIINKINKSIDAEIGNVDAKIKENEFITQNNEGLKADIKELEEKREAEEKKRVETLNAEFNATYNEYKNYLTENIDSLTKELETKEDKQAEIAGEIAKLDGKIDDNDAKMKDFETKNNETEKLIESFVSKLNPPKSKGGGYFGGTITVNDADTMETVIKKINNASLDDLKFFIDTYLLSTVAGDHKYGTLNAEDNSTNIDMNFINTNPNLKSTMFSDYKEKQVFLSAFIKKFNKEAAITKADPNDKNLKEIQRLNNDLSANTKSIRLLNTKKYEYTADNKKLETQQETLTREIYELKESIKVFKKQLATINTTKFGSNPARLELLQDSLNAVKTITKSTHANTDKDVKRQNFLKKLEANLTKLEDSKRGSDTEPIPPPLKGGTIEIYTPLEVIDGAKFYAKFIKHIKEYLEEIKDTTDPEVKTLITINNIKIYLYKIINTNVFDKNFEGAKYPTSISFSDSTTPTVNEKSVKVKIDKDQRKLLKCYINYLANFIYQYLRVDTPEEIIIV